MKYFLCFLQSLLISWSADAQVKKHQSIWTANVSGEVSNASSQNTNAPMHDLSVGAEWSLLVRNGLALGLSVNSSWTGNKLLIEDAQGLKSYHRNQSGALMPFIRKYWEIAPFIIFAGGGVNLYASKISSIQQINYVIYQQQRSTVHRITPQMQLGIIYPVTNRLGLEIGARSNLLPISFNSLHLGLVIISGTDISNPKVKESLNCLREGGWILSGTFSSDLEKGFNYDGQTRHEYRDPASSVELAAGRFMREGLVLGMGIYAGFQQGVFDPVRTAGVVSRNNHKKLLLGIRPYVKKYFSSTRLTPYVQGYLSYNRIMAGEEATNSFYAGSDFGLAYRLGKSLLVEGRLLGLSVTHSKTPDSKTDNATVAGRKLLSANLDAGFKPAFTVAYVFR